MRLFKVCTKSVYEDTKDGQAKYKWHWAGTMRITDTGAMYLRMHHQPDIQFHFFEQEFPVTASTNIEADNA